MHHEKRMQQQWLLKYDSLGKLLEKMRKEELHPESLSIIESMTVDYKLFGALFSQLQANFAKRKILIEENKPQTKINFSVAVEERLVAEALMRSHAITAKAFKLSAMLEQIIALTQQRSNLIIIFSIIGFVIFSSYISFLTIRAITKPINELIKGAEIIGKGDLEHKIDFRTKNEMGQLAGSFNQMAADLKVSNDKLDSHSKDLEKEVRKRTRELEKEKAGLEETVKRRTKELQERVSELERHYDATTDRELRMKELREEIERLKIQRPLEQKS
jgi:methyl-accepting chemotaxis protein